MKFNHEMAIFTHDPWRKSRPAFRSTWRLPRGLPPRSPADRQDDPGSLPLKRPAGYDDISPLDDTVVLAAAAHDRTASATGDGVVCGMVLYLGDEGVPSVIACTAVPLSALWEWQALHWAWAKSGTRGGGERIITIERESS